MDEAAWQVRLVDGQVPTMSWLGQQVARAMSTKKVAKDARIRSRFRAIRGFMIAGGATVAAGLGVVVGALVHDPHIAFILGGALMPVGTFGGAIVAQKAHTSHSLRLATSQEPNDRLIWIEEVYYQELDEIEASEMSDNNKAKYREQAFIRARNRKDVFNQAILAQPAAQMPGQFRLSASTDTNRRRRQ